MYVGRDAHIYRHGSNPVLSVGMQVQHLNAGEGFERYIPGLVRQAIIIQVFADAAACVSAHLGFRSICIEYTHTEVCLFGCADEHQSVAPDSGMRAAPFDG